MLSDLLWLALGFASVHLASRTIELAKAIRADMRDGRKR